MHRQPTRNTAIMDAVECMADTNDLALDNELVKYDYDQRSKSRRDQTSSKRSNESSTHRPSSRHSPPSVTRKRHPSPPSISSSSSSSRSHHRHRYPFQTHHRASSRSLSPPPLPPPPPPPPPPPVAQSSSRHRRPAISTKRPHSKSRSPYERRPPTQRSRPEVPTDRTIGDVLTSMPSIEEPKKPTQKQETIDLSLISEDESTKAQNSRSNSTTTIESSSITKLHSTPSIPIVQPNSNDSLLDMSNIPQECELSLYAKSILSTKTNTSSIITPIINSPNDFMQTIDLLTKYKTMQTIPTTNPQIEVLSKDVLMIIQKQIELQKIELDHREREIKLRERELVEREKRFQEKSSETISMTSVQSEPLIITKPIIIEENIQSKSETQIDQDIKKISSEEESIEKLSNKNLPKQISVTRKNHGRSRFSQIVDPSIFSSQEKPVVDLYADDLDDNQSSSSINSTNSLKKPIISKILAPQDDQLTIIASSSNSFRKVEIQSGNIDKTTNKGSSHDLRLTLSKNRTKQSNNDDDQINGNQSNNEDNHEQTIKIQSNNDNKQQSHDYQQQRSIASTSIETIIDNTNDKRDNHRHRQHQQHSFNSNERSYNRGSTQFKYGSNHKHYENDDLRSRLFEHKNPKSSRSTHKNNY